MAHFEITQATNQEYYFRLRATGDNQIILRSEGYTTKAGCKKGIDSVQLNASSDARYSRLRSVNNKYYFNLKAGNGEIIGTSLMYDSDQEREDVITLVKEQAPTAGAVDLS